MRKSRVTEHQIVRILKSVEGGRTVKDVCREHGVSSATYYKWKSKYGGLEASDIERAIRGTSYLIVDEHTPPNCN